MFEVSGVRARIPPQTFTPPSNTGQGFCYPGSCSASANPGSSANTSRNCFCSYRVKCVQQGIAAQEVTASWKFKIISSAQATPPLLQSGTASQPVTGARLGVSNSLRSTSSILCGHVHTSSGWAPQPAWSGLESTAAKGLSPHPCSFQLPGVLPCLGTCSCVGMPKQWCKRQQQQTKEINSLKSAQETKPLWPNERQDCCFQNHIQTQQHSHVFGCQYSDLQDWSRTAWNTPSDTVVLYWATIQSNALRNRLILLSVRLQV